MSSHSEKIQVAEIANSAGLSPQQIAELNTRYRAMNFRERLTQVYQDFDPAKILVTSSFAATSAYFLHIVSTIRPDQVIHFIDTGYHFPETLEYRQYLIDRFNLKVVDVHAEEWKHDYTVKEKVYETDPDFCCSINKVEPLDEIKPNFHLWVSSLMSWQTDHRAGMDIFEERRGIIKFNPMIDVTEAERDAYIREHDLPFHPLVAQGYTSIGCVHCTAPGQSRAGRWSGKPKTECGLHL